MRRTTKADVMRAFGDLATALGKHIRPPHELEAGSWHIDHNPLYGGIVIQETIDSNGAVTLPFGQRRTPPREFVEKVEFALQVLDYYRKNSQLHYWEPYLDSANQESAEFYVKQLTKEGYTVKAEEKGGKWIVYILKELD